MVNARSYFARMNENRGDTNWLTDDQLLRGTEQFFKLNDYSDIEYNKVLDQGGRTFSSPIVASRKTKYDDEEIDETMVTIFKSNIKNQEISVAIENLMRDGLFILFLNHRFAYALFDKFENMTKPIPVYD